MMKRFQWRWLIGFMFILTGCSDTPNLKDIDGNQIHLADHKGRWVIIHYWASWCKPCLEEIKELNAFHKAHKNKDAIVLGVNYDDLTAHDLKSLTQKLRVAFPTLDSDPAKQLNIGPIAGVPMSVVIGPDGTIKDKLHGLQTRESLEAIIQSKTYHG